MRAGLAWAFGAGCGWWDRACGGGPGMARSGEVAGGRAVLVGVRLGWPVRWSCGGRRAPMWAGLAGVFGAGCGGRGRACGGWAWHGSFGAGCGGWDRAGGGEPGTARSGEVAGGTAVLVGMRLARLCGSACGQQYRAHEGEGAGQPAAAARVQEGGPGTARSDQAAADSTVHARVRPAQPTWISPRRRHAPTPARPAAVRPGQPAASSTVPTRASPAPAACRPARRSRSTPRAARAVTTG